MFACANPEPEIGYEAARAARPDALVGTGRSDCPNQINNVLGFPFIFRGALDVRARAITDGMKLAAARALAALAREPVPECVLEAYGVERLVVRPRLPDPQAARSPDPHLGGAGRGASRRWPKAWRRLPVDLAAYPTRLAARRKHCPRRATSAAARRPAEAPQASSPRGSCCGPGGCPGGPGAAAALDLRGLEQPRADLLPVHVEQQQVGARGRGTRRSPSGSPAPPPCAAVHRELPGRGEDRPAASRRSPRSARSCGNPRGW